MESARLDAYLRFCPKHITIPVLLMLAESDKIIDNVRTRQFVESFAATDKTIIEYPAVHHTLEFEPEADKIIGDLVNWLREQTQKFVPGPTCP